MMIALKLVNNILFFKIYFNLSLSNNPPGVYFRVVSKIRLPWLPACRDAPYITVSYHCLGKVAIRSLFLVTDTYSRPIVFWEGWVRVGAIREGAHNVFKQGRVVLGVKKFGSSLLVFQQHLTNMMVDSEVLDQEIVPQPMPQPIPLLFFPQLFDKA